MENQTARLSSNNAWHYGITTKFFHWVIALLLIGMISLGWYMVSIENQPNSGWYFDLHKSFGLIVATLILLRVLWWLTQKAAPFPRSFPAWQYKIARIIHWLLYICIIVMPVTGFLGASFSKYGVAFFGLQLPTWVNQNHALSEQFFKVHGVVAWILVTLISLHVLAALKHLIINKDGVFQRMWFSK